MAQVNDREPRTGAEGLDDMAKALGEYRAKRDFNKTPEPTGSNKIQTAEYPRFVVQKHDATRVHYDLRLEVDGVFKSWAVTRGPSLDPAEKRLAVEVEDHPLEYGDFEGTIPEGEYGGGTVMLWDRGFWSPVADVSPDKALRDGELKFTIAGEKLKGSWVLVRMKHDRTSGKRTNWLLIKHRDEWAKPDDNDELLDRDHSVASGRTMNQIAAGNGTAPKPFIMSRNRASKPDAIWRSNAGAAGLEPSPTPRRRPPAAARIEPVMVDGNKVLGVIISKPDKVLWPAAGDKAITKRDLAEYLATVGPWMIRHITGRPCSVLRAPDGVGGQQFFQRYAMPGTPDTIKRVRVSSDQGPYLQIDDVMGLVAMSQLAAVEFHPWNNEPFEPTIPGRLIFDLDPAPELGFSFVVEAAKELRTRLEVLGLVAFCKTTGGKGLHVVTPLKVRAGDGMGWDEAKTFAQTICTQMAHDSPSRYVTKMGKKLRTGRIFLDYLRNDLLATAVAPLSPRARPGATVSMPLTWSQVRGDLNPQVFTIRTVPALLARTTAWKDYDTAAQSLRAAIKKLLFR